MSQERNPGFERHREEHTPIANLGHLCLKGCKSLVQTAWTQFLSSTLCFDENVKLFGNRCGQQLKFVLHLPKNGKLFLAPPTQVKRGVEKVSQRPGMHCSSKGGR